MYYSVMANNNTNTPNQVGCLFAYNVTATVGDKPVAWVRYYETQHEADIDAKKVFSQEFPGSKVENVTATRRDSDIDASAQKAWDILHDTSDKSRASFDSKINVWKEVQDNSEELGIDADGQEAIADKISALRLMREYYNNPEFKAALTEEVWQHCRRIH